MIDQAIPCPECGYDLRGSTSPVCPECGSAVDRRRLTGLADVPWQHRHQIGRWRAFWRTAWRVTARPGVFAREADRDLNPPAAWRFRMVCAAMAGFTLAIPAVFVFLLMRSGMLSSMPVDDASADPAISRRVIGLLADGLVLLILVGGMIAWVLIVSGVPRYFFVRRDPSPVQQERDRAMADYSAGPLAWVPFVGVSLAAVAGLTTLIPNWDRHLIAQAVLMAGVFAPPLLVGLHVMVVPPIMLYRGRRASPGRTILLAAALFVGWPVLFVVVGLLPAWTVFFVEVFLLTWQALGRT